MSDDINYDYKPDWTIGGHKLMVRISKDRTISLGGSEVNVETGKTATGLYIADTTLKPTANAEQGAQTKVEVVQIGPSAFDVKGFEDFKKSVKVGKKILIDQFSWKRIKDDEGRRTLYFYIDDTRVIGVVNNAK